MTEASDGLLLVQVACSGLHAADEEHLPVVLEGIVPRYCYCGVRSLVEKVNFVGLKIRKNKTNTLPRKRQKMKMRFIRASIVVYPWYPGDDADVKY